MEGRFCSENVNSSSGLFTLTQRHTSSNQTNRFYSLVLQMCTNALCNMLHAEPLVVTHWHLNSKELVEMIYMKNQCLFESEKRTTRRKTWLRNCDLLVFFEWAISQCMYRSSCWKYEAVYVPVAIWKSSSTWRINEQKYCRSLASISQQHVYTALRFYWNF